MSISDLARSMRLPVALVHLAFREEEREARAEGVLVGYRGDYQPYVDQDGEVRCAARCRDAHPCKRKGLGAGHRCPNHGGLSTGPRTPEGKQRSLEALAQYRAGRKVNKT